MTTLKPAGKPAQTPRVELDKVDYTCNDLARQCDLNCANCDAYVPTLPPGKISNLIDAVRHVPHYEHCPLCGKRTVIMPGVYDTHYVCNNCKITISVPDSGGDARMVDWSNYNV